MKSARASRRCRRSPKPLKMFGYSCQYPLLGYSAPCVGVIARSGEAALTVESSGVSIEDVAFGGGSYGIEAPGASPGFVARSDWFGLKLDATPTRSRRPGSCSGRAPTKRRSAAAKKRTERLRQRHRRGPDRRRLESEDSRQLPSASARPASVRRASKKVSGSSTRWHRRPKKTKSAGSSPAPRSRRRNATVLAT